MIFRGRIFEKKSDGFRTNSGQGRSREGCGRAGHFQKQTKKNKKKSKPMSDNGASSTPFVPEVSFARAAAEMDRGKRVGKSNYRGNNFRGNYSGNFNRGGYAFSNGRSRHPNAPPPIKVQKGQIFDYVGWMEEELRANSPEHVYNADFPPLSAESGKGKGSGPLTGSGSSDLLERSNNNLGSLNSPSGANSNNMRCSEQASFVMMPNTYVDSPPIYYAPAAYMPVMSEALWSTSVMSEFYFSAYNLKKDEFIRSAMDSDGYVQLLTNDIALISRILQNSKEVELDATGLKVRTKRNWERWLPSSQTAQLEAAEQNEKREQVSIFIIESGDSDEEHHNKHESSVEVQLAAASIN
uniref:HTH La-type RNA-binding domain-containing protein n=1 Tax=Ditylenchus dipsaci TaxID=166011 RepID=A0A915E9I3_9BILA